MKYISKSQAEPFANGPTCTGLAYDLDKGLDIALITINGRYPQTGHALNENAKEAAYVISGTGKIGRDGHEQELRPGDAIFVDKNEPYYWVGDDLVILTPSAPAFEPEHHRHVN